LYRFGEILQKLRVWIWGKFEGDSKLTPFIPFGWIGEGLIRNLNESYLQAVTSVLTSNI
jgi:hypothetical protein